MATAILRVVTRHPGGNTIWDYRNADWKVEDGWLLITHDDTSGKAGERLLSRVLVPNIVQLLEQLGAAQ